MYEVITILTDKIRDLQELLNRELLLNDVSSKRILHLSRELDLLILKYHSDFTEISDLERQNKLSAS